MNTNASTWRLAAVALLMGALAPSLIARCFHSDYLRQWDDGVYVLDAAPVREGLTAEALRKEFVEPLKDPRPRPGYMPLSALSHGLEQALYGERPDLNRLVNLLLHLASALLIWRLAVKLLPQLEPNYAAWAGLPVVLFVVHPTNVESVAWITERDNVLALALSLAALNLLVVRHPFSEAEAVHVPAGWARTLGALALYTLACLAKGTPSCYAVAFAAFELLMVRGSLAGRLLRSAGFLAIGAACVAANLHTYASVVVPPAGGSLGTHAMTACYVILRYAANLVWPFNLAYAYAVAPVLDPTEGRMWLGVAVILGWSATVLWSVLQSRAAIFLLLWTAASFGIFLAPQGLPALMHDRFLYWALPGLTLSLVLMLDGLFCRFGYVMNFMEQLARGFALMVLLGLAALYGWKSCQRSAVFASEDALFEDSVAKEPRSGLGQYWLADRGVLRVLKGDESWSEAERQRELDEALEHLKLARRGVNIERHPAPLILDVREGTILFLQGRLMEAKPWFEKILAVPPAELQPSEHDAVFEAHYGLAEIAFRQDPPQLEEALKHLEACLAQRPDHLKVQFQRAAILESLGRKAEALQGYEKLKDDAWFGPASRDAMNRLKGPQ
ncbi:MAG: hypothetical protein M5U26_28495 [Planctomycetota bacterium]|nr:hypothetical protein [Planctomycetota bacterium]